MPRPEGRPKEGEGWFKGVEGRRKGVEGRLKGVDIVCRASGGRDGRRKMGGGEGGEEKES